jgi:hypothetical protein
MNVDGGPWKTAQLADAACTHAHDVPDDHISWGSVQLPIKIVNLAGGSIEQDYFGHGDHSSAARTPRRRERGGDTLDATQALQHLRRHLHAPSEWTPSGRAFRPGRPDQPKGLGEPARPGIAVARQDAVRGHAAEGIE